MTLVKLETPELTVIEESKAAKIKATFEPMVEMLEQFEDRYNEILTESQNEITSELTQKAKRLRIDVGKVRIETDKLRKAEKDEYLRAGKAIDGVSNILKWAVSEKENKLKEIEDYFEIQEQKRLEALQTERVELLSPYVEDAHERQLSNMEQDVWEAYLAAKKKEYEDRIEAERKAEQERIEKEKAERAEQERIRKENERLRKEAEKKAKEEDKLKERNRKRNEELRPYIIFIRDYDSLLEANEKDYQKQFAEIKAGAEQHWEHERKEAQKKAEKEQKERETYEAKLKAEREERERIEKEERVKREKLEAELKAKKEAEQKEKQRLLDEQQAKLKAEKAARLAPDKDKLLQFAEKLNGLELPELKSNEAGEILKNIVTLIGKTTDYIKQKANEL